ncbi:MAG: hypothetical protein ACUVX8_03555 [Candidatus Zipacnadales bacterium]
MRLTRVVRTPTSEIYLAWEEERRVGQIDIHYGSDVIHATVILEEDLSDENLDRLLKQLDRDVVASYLQEFERENLLVSVFRGEEILTTSDEDLEESDEDADW